MFYLNYVIFNIMWNYVKLCDKLDIGGITQYVILNYVILKYVILWGVWFYGGII